MNEKEEYTNVQEVIDNYHKTKINIICRIYKEVVDGVEK